MTNRNDDYADLRQQIIETKIKSKRSDLKSLLDSISNEREYMKECEGRGDTDGVKYALENVMDYEQQANTAYVELQQLEPPQTSEAKAEWLARRQDLLNQKSVELLGGAHRYVTERMNITDDSPEYFELMGHVIEPGGDYQPTPTPDDICKSLNLDARTYNRGVRELYRRKAAGDYRDK